MSQYPEWFDEYNRIIYQKNCQARFCPKCRNSKIFEDPGPREQDPRLPEIGKRSQRKIKFGVHCTKCKYWDNRESFLSLRDLNLYTIGI